MLNFKSNFFFLQFSVLFFFIVIFGFWSIDLNSEEIYIAFSFFIMLVLGFIFFRANLMLVFMRILNKKYSIILSSLLKIRRLGKAQSVDFSLQFKKRLNFLNSQLFVKPLNNSWGERALLALKVSSFLWVQRSLLVILLGGGIFFSNTNTLRLSNFNYKINYIFRVNLV